MSTAPSPSPAQFTRTSSARRPRGWGRALTARRVARKLHIGQCWSDRQGTRWEVAQIHRKDRDVRLEAGCAFRYVTFTALGRDYREAPR
jgi:hypothetical protein